jgi:hypothetical protein
MGIIQYKSAYKLSDFSSAGLPRDYRLVALAFQKKPEKFNLRSFSRTVRALECDKHLTIPSEHNLKPTYAKSLPGGSYGEHAAKVKEKQTKQSDKCNLNRCSAQTIKILQKSRPPYTVGDQTRSMKSDGI